MAKSTKRSEIAKEIKKEYLVAHLKEVEELIESWIPELRAPEPFLPREGKLGWDSVYKPFTELDPDKNHMIKHHIRSRAFWRQHTDWELKLKLVFSLVSELRIFAASMVPSPIEIDTKHFIENFIGTTLLVAFENVRQKKDINPKYSTPVDGIGVFCGDFKIDGLAVTEEQQKEVEKNHLNLIRILVQREEMKQLVDCEEELEWLEEHMTRIATTALKSKDLLYPCRFCRHFWK